jgi:ABC-type Mn2+/Zn2+ transport system ATPase subunit
LLLGAGDGCSGRCIGGGVAIGSGPLVRMSGTGSLIRWVNSHAVDAELAAFSIEDRADALSTELSSGQRRRLALAAAFVRPARLMVLDEPERRLDAEMRQDLGERLASARDDGLAVLFAGHDAAFVQTVADRALLLGDEECRLLPPATRRGPCPGSTADVPGPVAVRAAGLDGPEYAP